MPMAFLWKRLPPGKWRGSRWYRRPPRRSNSMRALKMNLHKISGVCVALALASSSTAQDLPLVELPKAPIILRPYEAPSSPPPRLTNSYRLHTLIRAGKLYLTVQDAIALAIENNLDLEVDRYGPIIQDWQVKRAEAGGLLRGVTSGNSQITQVSNGQGVLGSQASAGLLANNNGG